MDVKKLRALLDSATNGGVWYLDEGVPMAWDGGEEIPVLRIAADNELAVAAVNALPALLDRLELLEAIVRDLLKLSALGCDGDLKCWYCRHCGNGTPDDPPISETLAAKRIEHAADCAWLRARAAIGGDK
jgi:hypothetical protein